MQKRRWIIVLKNKWTINGVNDWTYTASRRHTSIKTKEGRLFFVKVAFRRPIFFAYSRLEIRLSSLVNPTSRFYPIPVTSSRLPWVWQVRSVCACGSVKFLLHRYLCRSKKFCFFTSQWWKNWPILTCNDDFYTNGCYDEKNDNVNYVTV